MNQTPGRRPGASGGKVASLKKAGRPKKVVVLRIKSMGCLLSKSGSFEAGLFNAGPITSSSKRAAEAPLENDNVKKAKTTNEGGEADNGGDNGADEPGDVPEEAGPGDKPEDVPEEVEGDQEEADNDAGEEEGDGRPTTGIDRKLDVVKGEKMNGFIISRLIRVSNNFQFPLHIAIILTRFMLISMS